MDYFYYLKLNKAGVSGVSVNISIGESIFFISDVEIGGVAILLKKIHYKTNLNIIKKLY